MHDWWAFLGERWVDSLGRGHPPFPITYCWIGRHTLVQVLRAEEARSWLLELYYLIAFWHKRSRHTPLLLLQIVQMILFWHWILSWKVRDIRLDIGSIISIWFIDIHIRMQNCGFSRPRLKLTAQSCYRWTAFKRFHSMLEVNGPFKLQHVQWTTFFHIIKSLLLI